MDVCLDKRGHRVVGECCVWFRGEWVVFLHSLLLSPLLQSQLPVHRSWSQDMHMYVYMFTF